MYKNVILSTGKGIPSSIQIIEFMYSNHFHGHRRIEIEYLGIQTVSTNICEKNGSLSGAL